MFNEMKTVIIKGIEMDLIEIEETRISNKSKIEELTDMLESATREARKEYVAYFLENYKIHRRINVINKLIFTLASSSIATVEQYTPLASKLADVFKELNDNLNLGKEKEYLSQEQYDYAIMNCINDNRHMVDIFTFGLHYARDGIVHFGICRPLFQYYYKQI